MHQLVYVSSATHPFSKPELRALLEKSRANNHRLGVTGMLLYKDGNIMQVLEGERETLEPLFKTIGKDPRHKGVIELINQAIETRQFRDWSMGFRDLNDPDLASVPGYSDFLNRPLSEVREPAQSLKLLRLFRANM